MKLYIIYHERDEYSSAVENFAKECERLTDRKIEKYIVESADGADKARLYDVTDYPAILVVGDDGQLNRGWQGGNLPLVSEAIGYLNL